MYALFSRRSIIYVGEDQQAAIDLMAAKGNEECSMVMPNTLPALVREFEKYLEAHPESGVDPQAQTAEDEAVEAFNHFMDVLDEAGLNPENINDFIERAKSGSEDALKTVKAAAGKGIRGLGDCFERLGNFLKENAAEPEVTAQSHEDCCCQPGDECPHQN